MQRLDNYVNCLPPSALRRGLLLNPKLDALAMLHGRQAPRSCLLFLSNGVQTHVTTPGFSTSAEGLNPDPPA